ncbi:MAG: hypothetical protein IPO08_15495 [Xanthomonadales bacterium]|nr:hypothetical protein [Xanthomonadales bacterium]
MKMPSENQITWLGFDTPHTTPAARSTPRVWPALDSTTRHPADRFTRLGERPSRLPDGAGKPQPEDLRATLSVRESARPNQA